MNVINVIEEMLAIAGGVMERYRFDVIHDYEWIKHAGPGTYLWVVGDSHTFLAGPLEHWDGGKPTTVQRVAEKQARGSPDYRGDCIYLIRVTDVRNPMNGFSPALVLGSEPERVTAQDALGVFAEQRSSLESHAGEGQ